MSNGPARTGRWMGPIAECDPLGASAPSALFVHDGSIEPKGQI